MMEHDTPPDIPLEPTELADALTSGETASVSEADQPREQEGAVEPSAVDAAAHEEAEAAPIPIQAAAQDTGKPEAPARRKAAYSHLRRTRRQLLIGGGVALGLVGLGVGAVLALSQQASPLGGAPGTAGASTIAGASPAPTIGTTPGLQQQLDAWRMKHLTVAPTLRFRHQTGSASVPLGVVDPVYPNPYNPYQVRLQGYLLGGEIVNRTQLFWYLGLESIDGTQFVGKFRVGPVNTKPETFGIQVTEQSNDFIEGGGTPDYPIAIFAPKTLDQGLSELTGHCLVVTLLRQMLPSDATQDVPPAMLTEINQQAAIADQFAQFDVDVVQHTPFAQAPSAEVNPIRSLIDLSPISYRSSADAARYPLVTQVTLRQSDQLFPKLGTNT
jgi:hypothetical protein